MDHYFDSIFIINNINIINNAYVNIVNIMKLIPLENSFYGFGSQWEISHEKDLEFHDPFLIRSPKMWSTIRSQSYLDFDEKRI